MDKKRTGMTYEDFCENMLVVEVTEGHMWCEDIGGCYHYDGCDAEYFEDGKNSRDFVEVSDKVLGYLGRLYDIRMNLDD